MTTPSRAKDDIFQLELEQIQRVARMRYGVAWAFIFVSFGRGIYEIARREGFEGLGEGILYSVLPAAALAVIGFPMIRYYARKAEDRLRERHAAKDRRNPLA